MDAASRKKSGGWDQSGLWKARGSAGRSTPTIIKYKPRLVTTGTVVEPPYHTHHRNTANNDNDDEADFAGYRVAVRWWDPFALRWAKLKPVIAPSLDARRVFSQFPTDQRVFFTFVMYDRQPMYMGAIGRSLNFWDAQRVQRLLRQTNRIPPLERIRDASAWDEGEFHPLFPTHFAWSPKRAVARSHAFVSSNPNE